MRVCASSSASLGCFWPTSADWIAVALVGIAIGVGMLFSALFHS